MQQELRLRTDLMGQLVWIQQLTHHETEKWLERSQTCRSSYSVTSLDALAALSSLSSTVYESTGLVFPESQQIKAASGQLVHPLPLIIGGDGTSHRPIHNLRDLTASLNSFKGFRVLPVMYKAFSLAGLMPVVLVAVTHSSY